MGFLRNAIEQHGSLDAGGFEYRRHDINDMVELTADTADILDVAGPRHDHALPRPTEVRRHLLDPLERCIKRPRHCAAMCG